MIEKTSSLLANFGLAGTASLVGVYLTVAGIVGRFVPRDISIQSVTERCLLSILGLMLAGPLILGMWNHGSSFRIFGPVVQVEVEDASLPPATDGAALGIVLATAQRGAASCPQIERFGLVSREIRRLTHRRFAGAVHVYVDDIRNPAARLGARPFKLYVTTGAASLPAAGQLDPNVFDDHVRRSRAAKQELTVDRTGATLSFANGGRRYALTYRNLCRVAREESDYGRDLRGAPRTDPAVTCRWRCLLTGHILLMQQSASSAARKTELSSRADAIERLAQNFSRV